MHSHNFIWTQLLFFWSWRQTEVRKINRITLGTNQPIPYGQGSWQIHSGISKILPKVIIKSWNLTPMGHSGQFFYTYRYVIYLRLRHLMFIIRKAGLSMVPSWAWSTTRPWYRPLHVLTERPPPQIGRRHSSTLHRSLWSWEANPIRIDRHWISLCSIYTSQCRNWAGMYLLSYVA